MDIVRDARAIAQKRRTEVTPARPHCNREERLVGREAERKWRQRRRIPLEQARTT